MTRTTTPTAQLVNAPKRTKNHPSTARATRIMIVEDEPLTAEVFAKALGREGYLVDLAMDGLQAIRQLRDRTPSLIVLDMNLPAVSGVDVVREFRSNSNPDVPIVVVSGSAQQMSSLTTDELQPGVWLNKPIKPRDLVAIVRALLDES